MAEVRAFIALGIGDVVTNRLVRLQQQWRDAGADVNWIRPDGMHLTLRFLGNVPEVRLATIIAALDDVARGQVPFPFTVAGVGGFPTTRAPRILWAGIREGEKPLAALATAVAGALAAVGWPQEELPFHAHVTLGRVKSSRNRAHLAQQLANFSDELFGTARAADICLMRSDLSTAGAQYTALHCARFSDAG